MVIGGGRGVVARQKSSALLWINTMCVVLFIALWMTSRRVVRLPVNVLRHRSTTLVLPYLHRYKQKNAFEYPRQNSIDSPSWKRNFDNSRRICSCHHCLVLQKLPELLWGLRIKRSSIKWLPALPMSNCLYLQLLIRFFFTFSTFAAGIAFVVPIFRHYDFFATDATTLIRTMLFWKRNPRAALRCHRNNATVPL